MEAVFNENALMMYLGNDVCEAQACWELAENNVWTKVDCLNDLAAKLELLQDGLPIPGAKVFSLDNIITSELEELLERFIVKLDELGVNQESAKKLAEYYRDTTVGFIDSIRAVGAKSAVALNTTLREFGKEFSKILTEKSQKSEE